MPPLRMIAAIMRGAERQRAQHTERALARARGSRQHGGKMMRAKESIGHAIDTPLLMTIIDIAFQLTFSDISFSMLLLSSFLLFPFMSLPE